MSILEGFSRWIARRLTYALAERHCARFPGPVVAARDKTVHINELQFTLLWELAQINYDVRTFAASYTFENWVLACLRNRELNPTTAYLARYLRENNLTFPLGAHDG